VFFCPGHVLNVQGKLKECAKVVLCASLAKVNNGNVDIVDSTNPVANANPDSCQVCRYFVVASRADIRKIVYDRSRSLSVQSWKIKETLCAEHRRKGFSAQSQTRRKAGQSTDAPEARDTLSPLLPTFLNTISGKLLTPTRYRYSWWLHYKRFLRRSK
jgi:hypothetical protein